MKKNYLVITIVIVSLFFDLPNTKAQDLGATFCWHYNEIYGGHDYPYNQSIVTRNLPTVTSTKWEGMEQWWENMVEEVDYSGIDFVALLSRGTQPNQIKDLGMGDPKHIPTLVKYMKERNAKFKLCIFDDCPNSWRGSRNYDLYGKDQTKYELFDCSNTDNYKYIWDYNLKLAIESIPENMRYKIDNRMVIYFWSVKSTWFTNYQGNLSKILTYIKTQCQNTFGFTPYIIVSKSWIDNDNTISSGSVDAVHNWFSAAGGTSFTLINHNNVKAGVCVPSFVKPSEPQNGVLEPAMGTTDQGTRLKYGLDNTVKAGAKVTLAEGFTDAAEGAALWRSNDKLYYNYPNQRLNILRRYTKNPYPDTLRVEVEACDAFSDQTTGNSGASFLHEGDLDVLKCTDKLGGWFVTNSQATEWMEWKELPLQAKTKFLLRYKSSTDASIMFSVDGTALTSVQLPSTSDAWTTINAGTFTSASNGLHTVRLTVVSGTPDINYFIRVGEESISTAIHEEVVDKGGEQLSVNIYPNPYTSGRLSFHLNGFENNDEVKVTITNSQGKTVFAKVRNNSTFFEEDLSDILKASIYFITVEAGSHKIVKKLIVN